MLTLHEIRRGIEQVAPEYNIKSAELFGSYADGRANDESDVDLLVTFDSFPVTLFRLCGLKIRLEEIFGKSVDVICKPLPNNSILRINKTVMLYE